MSRRHKMVSDIGQSDDESLHRDSLRIHNEEARLKALTPRERRAPKRIDSRHDGREWQTPEEALELGKSSLNGFMMERNLKSREWPDGICVQVQNETVVVTRKPLILSRLTP